MKDELKNEQKEELWICPNRDICAGFAGSEEGKRCDEGYPHANCKRMSTTSCPTCVPFTPPASPAPEKVDPLQRMIDNEHIGDPTEKPEKSAEGKVSDLEVGIFKFLSGDFTLDEIPPFRNVPLESLDGKKILAHHIAQYCTAELNRERERITDGIEDIRSNYVKGEVDAVLKQAIAIVQSAGKKLLK